MRNYTVDKIDSLTNSENFYSITTIKPGSTDKVLFCTQGHKHLTDDQEVYYCISGRGIILQENTEETLIHLINKGSSVTIKPNYFHRLINTGDTELKVLCSGKIAAGHDYLVETKVKILDERSHTNE